jgi:flavin-dependent dehydrogenase
MSDTDIVVVGGGPGGTAAAIAAALAGLRTVLLDDNAAGADEPGETLPPGIETVLQKLGVSGDVERAAGVRHVGHWTDWSGQRRFIRFGGEQDRPWRGYQIRRRTLRQILVRRATDVGVAVRDEKALQPIMRGGAVIGVKTASDAILSRLLIDASGARHWLARARGDRLERFSKRTIAWYGWARSDRASCFAAPVFQISAGRWYWIAQVDADLCSWVGLDWRNGSVTRLRRPSLLAAFEQLGRERGADVTWRAVTEQGGDGFLYVGDAGAVLDPASSHGVLRALMTGVAAAHQAVRFIKGGYAWPAEVAAFDHWVKSMFRRDVSGLRMLYDRVGFVRRGAMNTRIVFPRTNEAAAVGEAG